MAKQIDLGDCDGIPVAGTTIAIRNAGDGLSKALRIEPKLLHPKQTVFVVLECEVIGIEFAEIKDANEVMRKQILRAGVATIIDRQAVIEAIDAQRDRIQAARDAETGAQSLFGGDDPDADPLGVEASKAPAVKKPRGATTGASKPSKRAGTAKKAGARKPGRPRKSTAALSAVPDPTD